MAFQINPQIDVQELPLNDSDLKLQCPFSMTISGCSQSGKSHFLYLLVKFRDSLFSHQFNRIIYCQSNVSSEKNLNYIKKVKDLYQNLEVCQGLPNLEELNLLFNDGHTLLLIDDLMADVLSSPKIHQLVTNDVHNYKCSVIITFQNYYASGKFGRTLVKNCQYRVFFYNNLDQYETKHISTQISSHSNFFSDCFDSLKKEFPNEINYYLLVDGHMKSKLNKLWCRSLIFPRGPNMAIEPIIFYPKSNKH